MSYNEGDNMLNKLCITPAPASEEDSIKKLLISELKSFSDSHYIDRFGNLIFEKEGAGDKCVIECGIDEPFLMATDGEDDKIRFSAPVHFKDIKFEGKNVVSADGVLLKLNTEADEEEKSKFSDLYSEKREYSPECGELFTLSPEFADLRESFSSENLIYKVPVFIMINAIKELFETKKSLCFLFSVNRCLALRGLRAYLSDNKAGSVLSVGCIKESEEDYIKIGEGAVICVKEKSCVPTVKLRDKLFEIAQRNNIKFSKRMISENLGLRWVLTTGFGAECGFVGVCYKENSTNGYEILKNDIKNVTKLIISYCKD